MTKFELVSDVAERTGFSKKDSAKFVEAIMESVKDALSQGEKVKLVGFGNFEVRERAERKGRNPQTQEEITIPARKAPAFKASKMLKETVKNA